MKIVKRVISITLLCHVFCVQSQPLTTENIVDPTVMSDSLRHQFEKIESRNIVKNNTPPQQSEGKKNNDIEDPTRMNENFRDALNHLRADKTGNANANPAVAAPKPLTPKIKLLANVQNVDKEKNYVILKIDDNKEMVSVGESITHFQGNQLLKIDITEITRKYVKVTLLPANQTLILR